MNILQSVIPYGTNISVGTFVLLLLAAFVLGILNMLVFSFRNRQSASSSVSLVLLPVAVCVVIMLVNEKLGAGIAVAGAFSLVRFRSRPGSARDIVSVFICVVLGAAIGMGYVAAAAILFVFTAVTVFLIALIPAFSDTHSTHRQLRVTISEDQDYNGLFDEVFRRYGVKARLIRVKSAAMGTLFELTYDISLPGGTVPKAFLDDIRVLNLNQTVIVGSFSESDML